MPILCGKCRDRHPHKEDVMRCYGLDTGLYLGPCTWLVEGPIATGDPDEPFYQGTFECGAKMFNRADGTGYECEAGHEHTFAEARQAQGWDYAEDEDEARRLVRFGVEPREITGRVWAR